MRTILSFTALTVLSLSSYGASAQTTEPEAPRYLEQIRSEFAALNVEAACTVPTPQRAHCTYQYRGQRSQREFELHLVYSDETDTIYLYVNRYLEAPADAPGTGALLQRLMTYNWRMLAGKFEWDETDGEVRLSVVFHTDSNFDRRTFRSLIRGLALQADAFYRELSSLAAAQEQPEPEANAED